MLTIIPTLYASSVDHVMYAVIIMLNIIPTLCAGYIVSVHRMVVMDNRPVDPGSIQVSHRPISFMRIKYRTRANDPSVKIAKLSINNHIVGLLHKHYIINDIG